MNHLGAKLIRSGGVMAVAGLLSAACGSGDGVSGGAIDDVTQETTVATGVDGQHYLKMRIFKNVAADVDRSWIQRLPSDPASDAMLQSPALKRRVTDLRAAKLEDSEDLGENAVGVVTPDGLYRGYIAADTDLSSRQEDGSFAQPGGSIEARGLSGGIDNRTRLSGASVPGGVGMVVSDAGQGSGTMVGVRILRTAAHVVIRHTTGGGVPTAQNNVRFDYRRDGATIGTRTWSSGYYYGGNYISRGCATAKDLNGDGDISDAGEYAWGYFQNRVACEVEDWALAILPSGWWGAAGMQWIGYRMLGSGETNVRLTNGGYAACTGVDAPSPCTTNGYYRDASTACKLGTFVDGVRVWNMGCDSSAGMSGGTAQEYSTGYFLGHPISGCDGCTSTFPNRSMGYNQWLYDFQTQVRLDNP